MSRGSMRNNVSGEGHDGAEDFLTEIRRGDR